MISISIIIPVFNEEKTIQHVLEKINKIKNIVDLEIIIINDGSTDKSKEIIEKNSKYFHIAKHLSKNFGKGKAIIEGLRLSTKNYIFFQDADLEYDPKDLKEFIEIIIKYKADMVMGSRFTSNKRSVLHFWHMLGNQFITFIFNLLNNTTFSDIFCCYCLFEKQKLPIHKLKSFSWGQHAEILTYLSKNSNKIYETAVNYDGRKYSEGKKIRYFHIFEILYCIIVTRIKILFI